jgi:anti-sigma B factor antagonist
MRPLNLRDVGGVLIVVLDDPTAVNDGQSDQFRTTLYEKVEEINKPRVAVDLSLMDFLSSSGVALLVGLRRRVDALQGGLVLLRPHPYVQDLLRMMKLAPLFQFADDEPTAITLLPPS